jgi:cytochrome c oxidase subunit 2
MSFSVVADRPAVFRRWLAAQARPAAVPRTAAERAGLRAFLSGPCSTCHTIRGTSAASDVGPDLTHVASRATLAAGTIPNRTPYLRRWIVDSQYFKPGNEMPDVRLTPAQLRGLVAYLEALR